MVVTQQRCIYGIYLSFDHVSYEKDFLGGSDMQKTIRTLRKGVN